MSNKPRLLFARSGPLIALAIAVGMLLSVGEPTSAQFFNFGGYQQQQQRPPPQRNGGWFGGGGWFSNDAYEPFQQRAPPLERRQSPPPPREDFSRAPPPEKRATVPTRSVLVIGDAMADWLAYGLEGVYSEQPDFGVIRKHKTTSGLIKYQPKGEPADWVAAAKVILAAEKADAIVVMLGLNDRIPIREPVDEKSADKKGDGKVPQASAETKNAKPGAPDGTANADGKRVDGELSPDDTGQAAAPEKVARSPNGVSEFRDERWVKLYNKKLDDMIGVLKSKGVPVLWVGLPAVRGQKSTSDMLFLDKLYREAAAKGGITYVDVWEGFVDEAGNFVQRGPDFEGQIRQLRTNDGVFFTRAGARKLAHYVEREITRLLARLPIALPSEPATPDADAVPGQPAPRPLAGPIIPLVASSIAPDQLLGGPGSRPAALDSIATRALVKGEALSPPAGRADDFVWPRREIGREHIKGDPLAASAAMPPTASAKPKKYRR
ncbi:hypothetical protein ACH79_37135 [Bradyrhizobium sp. CCBAU 051011]|uniref:SGNH/GDSL hydrolase family protein n=1 Tax=Bradyrhizobium sp. CCBAU 051011 TaxID=858422 RepID=UPI0013746E2C|nr:SGNH family hydrolase [Bradyrhizobium sp. CCBAU 051011]QHO77430.1 hypothetical protein ACH79_37135 [Bradyrhizobium sp. CCBAU 051011]